MNKKIIFISLMTGILLLNGCNSNQSEDANVCTESTGIPFNNVKVIEQEALLDVIEVNSTHHILLLNSSVKNIKKDDVLVFDSSAEHPGGMIKKVSTLSQNNAITEVTAGDAGLGDIFEELNLCHQGKLKEDAIRQVNLESDIPEAYDGALGKEHELYDFTYTIDKAFADDVVHLTGKMHFEIDYDLVIRSKTKIKCSWAHGCHTSVHLLSGTKFTIDPKVSTSLTLTAEKEYEKKESKVLYSVNFEPITIPVAGIPVVIVPELYIIAGIDVDVDGSMETGVWAKADGVLGIKYHGKHRGWKPVSEINHSFGENPLSIDVSAMARAYVGPKVKLKLYDVTGPYANLDVYAELDADIHDDPWWKLHAGLESAGGFKVKVLHHTLVSVHKKLYSRDFIILKADGKFP